MTKTLLALLALVFTQFTYSESTSFRWCVKSTAEKSKCEDFVKYVNKTAQDLGLDVTVGCVQAASSDDCVTKIASSDADLVTLDAGRVLDAGKTKDLIPIVSEKYGQYRVKYYAVAVVKKANKDLGITSLKGKKSCHTGARRNAGWRIPIGYMLRKRILPAIACGNDNNDFISAASFFSKSCVPGVKQYNTSGDIPEKLCTLCKGTGEDQCSGDSEKNEYAGHEGSFKCMADGRGDVAFFKHGTAEKVLKLGGHGTADDYQYLCKDGSRAAIGQYEKCNLGFNPALAVITRKGNAGDINNIISILTTMSGLYGVNQTNTSEFQLFNSTNYSANSSDLIFRDSTTDLVAIAENNRTYQGYLGDDYIKGAEALTSCDFMTSTTLASKPSPPAATATKPYTLLLPFIGLFVLLTM